MQTKSKLFPLKWTCLAYTYQKKPLYFISIPSIKLAHFNNFNELQTMSKGEKKCVWENSLFFFWKWIFWGYLIPCTTKITKQVVCVCVGYYSTTTTKAVFITLGSVCVFCFFCRVSVFGCFLILQYCFPECCTCVVKMLMLS